MVFFRVDSNSTIAGGHLMRCLAIAKALIKSGEKVCFLVADNNPVAVLEEANIEYTVLHSNWQDLMSDLDKVIELLKSESEPKIVVDTYSATKAYVDAIKPFAKTVYLGSKSEYIGKLDLLINYSTDIDYDFYHASYSDSTKLLLGPSYAPLRDEFQNVIPTFRDDLSHVLLTTGNTDRDHMVDAVLKKLMSRIDGTDIVIDVVVGRMFDNKNHLLDIYDCNNICFHENVRSMSFLMRDCDLAISANGTTVYELSAMGLPTITFAMVPEQIKSAEALSSLGVVDYCGRSYEDQQRCVDAIVDRFDYYHKHHDEMIRLAKKAHNLIDGNGCQKIVNEIVHL